MRRAAPALCALLPRAALAWGFAWPPATSREVPVLQARVGGGGGVGLTPEFEAAERTRLAGEAMVAWAPVGPVRLDLRGSFLSDRFASGRVRSGPGDLRLGTDARIWRGPVDLRVGWQVKLPNAGDEVGLGTDETDSTLLVAVVAPLGPASVSATGGLAILGNPLQFANQDDVPLSYLAGELPLGPFVLGARAGGAWRTSRNPGRTSVTLGVEGACPWLVGAEVEAGTSPAAPDWGGRAWVGWGWGCPE